MCVFECVRDRGAEMEGGVSRDRERKRERERKGGEGKWSGLNHERSREDREKTHFDGCSIFHCLLLNIHIVQEAKPPCWTDGVKSVKECASWQQSSTIGCDFIDE